jgi:hypothetical protein
MRRFVAHFNFLCVLIGYLMQSITGHVVNRLSVIVKRDPTNNLNTYFLTKN